MYSRTSIVFNDPSKIAGLPPSYYRLRNCDTNLTSNTPANQYQRLKLIQNTVRVASSLYTMNLGSLAAYVKPTNETYGVCWNQMSDRSVPSVQRATVPTGKNNSLNNRHYSVTSSRPGCQTPGGVGCDIKHNSYDRYLNRLKGKGPLRRGVIPPTFGAPYIPFNPAFPIYGAKTIKTSIVGGCDCPIQNNNFASDLLIYNDPNYQDINQVSFTFSVGQYVYAKEGSNDFYTKALIIVDNGGIFTVEFSDGTTELKTADELRIYYPCNCGGEIDGVIYEDGFLAEVDTSFGANCLYPSVSL
jgi:hypothetical protein